MIDAMQASLRKLQQQLNEKPMNEAPGHVDVNSYLSLLPDRTSQRVMRAMIHDIFDSKTFLKSA